MKTGKLVRWNDDKGFGFIKVDSGKDVFIHISALGHMIRRPMVGDVIFFQEETDDAGKSKAINARIEGVPRIEKLREPLFLVPLKTENIAKTNIQATASKPMRPNYPKPRHENNHRGISSMIASLIIIALAVFAYETFSIKDHADNYQKSLLQDTHESPKSQFQCTGKTHCSEMSSCEEAIFYINNCPGTEMDGDHDGIPCERQWCN